MLKITRIGTSFSLDIPQGQKITIEMVSMLLGSSEVLQGSYSYPFQFPLNENNIRFLENGHLPETEVPPEIPVVVSEGIFTFRALMGYEIDGDFGDGYLRIDLGEIAEILKNQPIRELVREIFVVSSRLDADNPTITMAELAAAPPATYPVVFAPFLAENFVPEDFEPGAGYKRPMVINPFMLHSGDFLDVADGDYGERSGDYYDNYNVVHVPFVYLVWLLRRIVEKLGFRAIGPALEDQNIMRMVLFNTQAIPGHVNGKYTIHIERHLPFESISALFSALRDYLGLGISFNTSDRTAHFAAYKHLRREQKAIDLSDEYIPTKPKIQRGEWKGYRIINEIGDNDEKLQGLFDYVKSFKVGENPDAEVRLSISTLAMQRMVASEAMGATPPSEGWGPEAIRWFVPTTSVTGNLSNRFFDKHEGGPNYPAASNYVEYVPELAPDMQHIEELANSEPVKSRWGLRLLMYFGYQLDSADRPYPQLSSVSYGAKYQTIGDLSLLPGQPDDVFRKYQRYWYECLAFSRKIDVALKLSIGKASQLRPEIPIYLRMEHLAASRYLLKKINYELPSQAGYLRARLEAIQLTPVNSKPNWADPDIYGAKWLEIKLENITLNANSSIAHGDIVIYVWEDGERKTPFNSISVVANVGVLRKELVDVIPTRHTEKKLAAGSFQLTQHRNVIYTQIKYYEGRDIFLGGQYAERQIVLFDQYYLQYGEGYRIILD